MATLASNTFLALTLFFASNTFAVDVNQSIRKAYAQKKYSKVIKIYNIKKYRSRILKKAKSINLVAGSFTKRRSYGRASDLYWYILKSKYSKNYRYIAKRIKNGQDINAKQIPKKFKSASFSFVQSISRHLRRVDNYNSIFKKKLRRLERIVNVLIELEYKDSLADKYLNQILSHKENLLKNKFSIKKSLTFDILSWQKEITLNRNDNSTTAQLLITNKGICLGGQMSYQNQKLSYSLNSCLLLGIGDISENSDSNLNYSQGNIMGFGMKASPGLSFFVSEKKAELGFKIPIMYFSQTLEEPNGYNIDAGSNFNMLISVFSKWPIDKYFLQTEFARFISKDLTLWSIGFGRSF